MSYVALHIVYVLPKIYSINQPPDFPSRSGLCSGLPEARDEIFYETRQNKVRCTTCQPWARIAWRAIAWWASESIRRTPIKQLHAVHPIGVGVNDCGDFRLCIIACNVCAMSVVLARERSSYISSFSTLDCVGPLRVRASREEIIFAETQLCFGEQEKARPWGSPQWTCQINKLSGRRDAGRYIFVHRSHGKT